MNKNKLPILQGLADGIPGTVLAKELQIGYRTFKNYTAVYRQEAGAETTIQLIAMSLRRGEIE